jgi:DNA invertase Pin-like site-specific DNA recombinase
MKSQGVGATEIAKALGIGRATVYRVLAPGR